MKKPVWILGLSAFCAHAQTQTKLVCTLPKALDEISGLISVKGQFWALNDGQNPDRLYSFDPNGGKILDSTTFSNTSNIDWEALAANDSLVFIGDMGNNNSNRKNLRIYFFPAALLGQKDVQVDTLEFFYPEQTDFQSNPLGIYDCEAMIALKDRIYLLSKSYGDVKCRLYELPIKKGRYPAQLRDSSTLYFWITDAALWNDSLYCSAYMYLGSFTDFFWQGTSIKEGRFQGTGDVEEITFDGADQWESICTPDGQRWFAACEAGNGNPAALYELLDSKAEKRAQLLEKPLIFPNPASNILHVNIIRQLKGSNYCILDSSGKPVLTGELCSRENQLDIGSLSSGNYNLCISKGDIKHSFTFTRI